MPKSARSPVRRLKTQKNKQALIDATLDSIVELGIAATSVTEIIERADLSRGMIHLHFGSKDNLLVEAVKQTGELYYRNLEDALSVAGNTSQERIVAVIDCDLGERTLNHRSVNIWYAFRGEARERSKIALYTDTRDKKLNSLLFNEFRVLAEVEDASDATELAVDATHGTLAMMEGFWTDFLLHPDAFDRNHCKRVILRFISVLFPSSIGAEGPIFQNRAMR
ncbi:MAG: TetR family transcriptional regulator C-terminal domain-containing protein [Pseudomonadota bacterium]